MAAGKNAASSILEKKGFSSIDCDAVVHQILSEKDFVLRVVNEFESEAREKKISLLKNDGTLDRRALGEVVFSDKKLLERQESLVFPEVENRVRDFVCAQKNAVINATVLWKIPALVRDCNAVLFVDAPILLRFFRVKKRDSLPVLQIVRRFLSQKNLFSKYRLLNADTYIVKNTGDFRALELKIDEILGRILARGV